jgi:glycosyltransferase involved in cell wall biosynthesis
MYWYWPHPHRAASPLCLAVIRPGDALTVQALPSLNGERFEPVTEYEVVRDLPDPSVRRGRRIQEMIRPAGLAFRRSTARRRLLRRGFDVAHIGNLAYQTDWFDLRALRKIAPLVCDVHDVRPHRQTMPVALESFLLRRTYDSGGHLIVLHEALRQQLLEDFHVNRDRVHVIPHVVDPTATRDPAVQRPARPVLLFFGTVRPNKGVHVLVKALMSLGPKLDADVVIAGEADDEIVRRLTAAAARLPNMTLELGRVTTRRKQELWSSASWAILPYVSFHSQSGVLADAYAYRVPAIVSDVGAIGPTVRDDCTGLVVPPNDVEALADALMRAVVAAPAQFVSALDRAAARHDVSVVGTRLRALYDVVAQDI